MIIQASRSPGAKVRASSGVGFSNHSSQAARRQAARRRAARRRAVRRRGARWPCLRLPPRAAHSRPPPRRVRRPSPAWPTGSWLQRRAAPQWRHRLRQASRKLHQLRRHPTLLGFRTTSSRGTERPACSMVSLGRGKACGPSFQFPSCSSINHTAGTGGGATVTVTETIYCRHGPVLRVDRVYCSLRFTHHVDLSERDPRRCATHQQQPRKATCAGETTRSSSAGVGRVIESDTVYRVP